MSFSRHGRWLIGERRTLWVRVAGVVVLLAVGMLLAVMLRLPSHLILDNGGAASPLQPLTASAAYVQQLELTGKTRLVAVEVLLATWGKPTSTTNDAISVYGTEGDLVAQRELPPGSVLDNSFVRLDLPEALDLEAKQSVFTALSSEDGTKRDSITAWSRASHPQGLLVKTSFPGHPPANVLGSLESAEEQTVSLCMRLYGLGPRALALETIIRYGGLVVCLLLAALVWMAAPFKRRLAAPRALVRARYARLEDRFMHSRPSALGRRLSEDDLIRFDLKTQLFCAAGLLLFVVLVVFNIHFSSVEMWNAYLPSDRPGVDDSSLVAGDPKAIRSDEWMVSTPQLLHDYGDGQELSTARYGLDVVSPWNWGFHLLGQERGFAFWWDFWVFGCVYGLFFLMMLLSGNQFGLSVFSAFFALFSSYNRWWDITAYVTTFSLALVGLLCFFLSRKTLNTWLAFALLCVFGLKFALFSYPAWQVTLGYLMVFVVVGVVVARRSRAALRVHWRTKLTLAGVALVVGAGGAIAGYLLNKETYEAMLNTVYPGRRLSAGGDVTVGQFFSGYLDPFFSEERYFFGNICESSSFILLFPFVAVAVVIERLTSAGRRIQPLIWALIAYLALLSLYMLIGYSEALSRLLLLNFVPGTRAFIGLGLASIMLMGLYLAEPAAARFPAWAKAVFALLSFAVLAVFASAFEHKYGFPTWSQALWVCAALAAAVAALLFRVRWLFYCVMLLLVVVPSLGSNPVASGLEPIFGKRLVQKVEQVARERLDERWLVYGDLTTPEIVRAAGADVFNGVSFPPEIETMKALDPSGKRKRIWNRFAHIQATPIWRRPARFKLLQDDYYRLGVSPDDPALVAAGVGLFVVPSDDTRYFPASRYRYLTPEPLNGYYIVERKPR